jgi:cyclopropane fatty-acyl-phospholipid synthase-like methyltransferase
MQLQYNSSKKVHIMIKIKRCFDAGLHCDSITAGWRYIFGENFHFGYFKTPEDDLDSTTDNLIDELAMLYDLKPETKNLDAGCGIWAPAIYLNEKFGSDIMGISTSKKGIDLANSRIKGGEGRKQNRVYGCRYDRYRFPGRKL